jgi:hypothetical protein
MERIVYCPMCEEIEVVSAEEFGLGWFESICGLELDLGCVISILRPIGG